MVGACAKKDVITFNIDENWKNSRTWLFIDDMIYTPERRKAMGMCRSFRFDKLNVKKLISKGWTFQKEDIDGEKCVSMRKGNALFATIEEDSIHDPIFFVPIRIKDKMYIFASDVFLEDAVEISADEYEILSGHKADEFIYLNFAEADINGEYAQIVDMSQGKVYFATHDKSRVLIKCLDTKSFIENCEYIAFYKADGSGDILMFDYGDVWESPTPVLTSLNSILSNRSHSLKGDTLILDMDKLLGGKAKKILDVNSQIISVQDKENVADQIEMFSQIEDSMKKESWINRFCREIIVQDNMGNTLLKTSPTKPVSVRVTDYDGETITLLTTSGIKNGIFKLSETEFDYAANMKLADYLKKFPLIRFAKSDRAWTIADMDCNSVIAVSENDIRRMDWKDYIEISNFKA